MSLARQCVASDLAPSFDSRNRIRAVASAAHGCGKLEDAPVGGKQTGVMTSRGRLVAHCLTHADRPRRRPLGIELQNAARK